MLRLWPTPASMTGWKEEGRCATWCGWEADRLTQLGRALRELGIGSILAYSPQAKGAYRAQLSDVTGPAGERLASGWHLDDGSGQRF